MKTCKLHIQFRKDCINCLLDRISRLESNLDGINAIASDANETIRGNGALDLDYYRNRLRSLESIPRTFVGSEVNLDAKNLNRDSFETTSA